MMSNQVTESSSSRAPRNNVKEKPKRPLSAYNLFFQDERVKLLDSLPTPKCTKTKRSHGKIGFAGLARTLAEKWKVAPDSTNAIYEELAAKKKRQYALDMVKWAQEQEGDETQDNAGNCETPTTPEPDFEGILDEPQRESQQLAVATFTTEASVQIQEQRCEQPHERNRENWMPEADPFCMASQKPDTKIFVPPQHKVFTTNHSSSSDNQRYNRLGNVKAWAPSVTKADEACQQMRSETPMLDDPSAKLISSFLQQPGMADFVSKMYNLLSQSLSLEGRLSSLNAPILVQGHPYLAANPPALQLPPRPCEPPRGQAFAHHDALLGSLEPFERDTEYFLDDDSLFGDTFSP